MNFIKDFKDLNKGNVRLAGGKGASLGEMIRAGIPVPPGFVVLSSAFEKFLEETDLNIEIDSILHSVNHKEIHTIENASEKIHSLILGTEMPKDIADEIQQSFQKLNANYVAVRSSATAEDSARAAWAGQLESYLNTTKENLLENIKKCWASLFTPRAIFYRFEKDLHKQKISVAVCVQKMVESKKSGIVFSVHPVTQDRNQLIIEAGFGLGEAIVSGQITPDSYVVEKQPRRIIDKNIQTQSRGLYRAEKGGNEWHDIPKAQGGTQVLSDKEIEELSEIILRIENHYGFPVDIEWAYEKEKFYIVQSRPITTILEPTKVPKEEIKLREAREVMVSHQSDLLTQDLILSGIYKHCKFGDYGLSFDFPYIRYEHGSGDISYPIWQVEELKRFDISEKDLAKLISFLETELEEYKNFLKDFKKHITSDQDKINRVKKYFEKSLKGASTIPYFAFEMSLYKKLEEEGTSPKDIPSSPTDTSLASLELEKIYSKHKEILGKSRLAPEPLLISEELKTDLKKFCNRFGYLGMIYFKGNPWTITEAYRMLFTAESKKPEKEKTKKNLPKFAKFASDLLRLRTQKWELMCYGTYLFRKFIKQFFFDEIIYEELLNLRITEVIDFIEGKYSLKEMGRGREYFVLEIMQNGVVLSTTKTTSEILKEEIREQEINGVVAQTGKVIGKAKIVLTPKDGYKVEIGDILITKMSTPDFLPIMKKAAAFVTDIGGITSHAAIVSREMGKPCIIGTKIGTKLLKDGDLIEVDANLGVVRILKSE